MSLLSLCVCKVCRKWETWVSTIGRQEKKGRETNFAQAWQRPLQSALNLSYTIEGRLSGRKGKGVVFSCKVCALSDSASSLKTQRKSDCGISRMGFCECSEVFLYPQHILSVQAFTSFFLLSSTFCTNLFTHSNSLPWMLCWFNSILVSPTLKTCSYLVPMLNGILIEEPVYVFFTRTSLIYSSSSLSEAQPVWKSCQTGRLFTKG